MAKKVNRVDDSFVLFSFKMTILKQEPALYIQKCWQGDTERLLCFCVLFLLIVPNLGQWNVKYRFIFLSRNLKRKNNSVILSQS
jgi:hypothetical protein